MLVPRAPASSAFRPVSRSVAGSIAPRRDARGHPRTVLDERVKGEAHWYRDVEDDDLVRLGQDVVRARRPQEVGHEQAAELRGVGRRGSSVATSTSRRHAATALLPRERGAAAVPIDNAGGGGHRIFP